MLATQVLSEDISENTEKGDDSDELVGYIVINNCRYEIKKGETKIGRDPTECSVVIENFTVSKVHACIESEGIDDTFIYDAGSTNQTKLGKKTLKPHCRYKLENNSNLTFGNISAKFMLPLKTEENSSPGSNLEIFKAPNGLEDIFDIETQVTVPHLQTSGKILQFKKTTENSQAFKIPDFVDSGEKLKESPKTPKIMGCESGSQDSVLRTEFHSGSHEPTAIFSLSTQCQIIQPSGKSEDKTASVNQSKTEPDLVKSFLCDGQDSVLCTFMSLHSPSGQAQSELPKEIKPEILQENNGQLFDAQTQMPIIKINNQDSEFHEDVCRPKSSDKCNAPLHNRSESNSESVVSQKLDTSAEDPEQDFVKTQEFIRNQALECKATSPCPAEGRAHQDSDTECYFEKTAESLSENEDFICTQNFEALFKNIQGTDNKSPQNEKLNESNEDFLATQLYDFEKEQNNKRFGEETSGNPTGIPFVVSESPEKDTEPYMEAGTDLTQRNAEEDFIGTQAFSETTHGRNADFSNSGSSGRSDEEDNDEDFIATQQVDQLLNSTARNGCLQEPIAIQIAFRESSPDLLDSRFSMKTSTDFIKISPKNPPQELSEKVNFSISVKKELNEDTDILLQGSVERIESSGEETESDLEIIFDRSETSKKRIHELTDKSHNDDSPESSAAAGGSEAHENDSNSSYVFQLEPEEPTKNTELGRGKAAESDSDATDCEDVAVVDQKKPVQQEILRTSFDETQAPTSPPPNNFARPSSPDAGGINDKDSPSFEIGNENECWSQLSLQMPSTQDMESTLNRILSDAAVEEKDPEKDENYQTPSKIFKTEVKTFASNSSALNRAKGQIDSPLKRSGNACESEAAPAKKSKIETSDRKLRSSEKQFLKVWQVHDFGQIQPSRTRSSLKKGASEKKSNKTDTSLGSNISNYKFATSRRETKPKRNNNRKLSFDITPHLCKKVENDKRMYLEGRNNQTPPEENFPQPKPPERSHRVLRSSTRNSVNTLLSDPFEHPSRQSSTRSTRNSMFRKEDYFSNPCVNVVFTGFHCESLENTISDLGGKKTDDLSSGDVVVADKVRRTVKFLCAVALSLPITSPQWLVACRAERKFVNPWKFLLKDEESERKWGFELKASLERSKNAKLMRGLSVFATANAKPPVKDLMAIVKYCGGTPLFEPPETWPKKTIIVSCPEDEKWWPLPKFRNVRIVHYEFVLIGVLRQKLDFKTYKLR